jgi:hypothetical protein
MIIWIAYADIRYTDVKMSNDQLVMPHLVWTRWNDLVLNDWLTLGDKRSGIRYADKQVILLSFYVQYSNTIVDDNKRKRDYWPCQCNNKQNWQRNIDSHRAHSSQNANEKRRSNSFSLCLLLSSCLAVYTRRKWVKDELTQQQST